MKILIAGYLPLCKNYINAVKAAGAVPEVSLDVKNICERVPNRPGEGKMPEFSGLLLPGGGDMNPKWFGQENHGSDPWDDALDDAQMAILERFVNCKLPVLGICRGHQVINVFFGGDIIQDLGAQNSAPDASSLYTKCRLAPGCWHTAPHGDVFHKASAKKGSWIENIYGEHFVVNSRHHQAIGRLGHGLSAVAWAMDGVVEGIVHENLPIYGVQWHPERMDGGVEVLRRSLILA